MCSGSPDCGRVWVWDDGWERDAPISDALHQPGGDGDVILQVLLPVLSCPLLHMNGDELDRVDIASHSEFSSRLSHF